MNQKNVPDDKHNEKNLIQKALSFAALMHEGQLRKGTNIPYLTHPAEIAVYLAKVDAPNYVIAAGILHDVVEDSRATIENIGDLFGNMVARLVASQTEDKTQTWLARKMVTEARLEHATIDELLICCTDKLSNLKTIDAVGESIWKHFKGTKEQTQKHYAKLKELYKPLMVSTKYKLAHQIYEEFLEYYTKVFESTKKPSDKPVPENPLIYVSLEEKSKHVILFDSYYIIKRKGYMNLRAFVPKTRSRVPDETIIKPPPLTTEQKEAIPPKPKYINLSSAIQNLPNLQQLYQDKNLETYYNLIIEWNKKFNLTAITNKEEVYIKHFYDSLLGLNCFKDGAKILDIGSGAGLPSIPLKLLLPNAEFTLVESVNKKVMFLNHVIGTLGLEKIRAIHTRIEDFKQRDFDFVTARAVAPMPTLCEYALPFLKIGGIFVAYKGTDPQTNNLENILIRLGGKVESIKSFKIENMERYIYLIKKVDNTPPIYPRPQNKPRTNPLK